MKVLLLGDYSGLGTALKEGLLQLGINATLATNGDSWKKISKGDIPLYPITEKGLIAKINNYCMYPSITETFRGYDIVQAPGPNIFFWGAGVLPFYNVKKYNGKFFMCAAGVDYYLYQAWKNKRLAYDYYMYDNNPELCAESDGKSISSLFLNYRTQKVMHMVDGIIPVIPYEYEVAYQNFSNLREAILLPVNTDKIQYSSNAPKRKIVFFHGVNRIKDKGSDVIIKAMKKVQTTYPNDVECIIADRMPYNQYIEAINKANVIVDQCKSYGYGINACISMAKGKLVMSGAEKAVAERISDACPVINIKPSETQIITQMLNLLEKRDCIEELGFLSRKYVEKHHNYIDIASEYLNTWKK